MRLASLLWFFSGLHWKSAVFLVKGSLWYLVVWDSHRPLFSCYVVGSIASSGEISLHMRAYGFRVLCSNLYGNFGFLHPGVCLNRPLYVGPRTPSLPFCVPVGAALHCTAAIATFPGFPWDPTRNCRLSLEYRGLGNTHQPSCYGWDLSWEVPGRVMLSSQKVDKQGPFK